MKTKSLPSNLFLVFMWLVPLIAYSQYNEKTESKMEIPQRHFSRQDTSVGMGKWEMLLEYDNPGSD